MRIASWNLRFDSMPDGIPVAQTLDSLPSPLEQPRYLSSTGEQPWSTRRVKVAQQLLSDGVILAGLQEALVRQVSDMKELLGNDEWDFVGVGRDDGVAAGEFCPIFYKRSSIKLLSSDTFWLSNTPFKPSKFPGAGSIRICTVACLQMISGESPTIFTLLNTHLDDQSEDQRRLGASLILTRARFEAVRTCGPVLVTGDLNSPSTGKDSGAYRIMAGAIPSVPIDPAFAAKYNVRKGQEDKFFMEDLRGVTPRLGVSDNFATFTGFTGPKNTSQWTRIDFVFGGSNGHWCVVICLSRRADDRWAASAFRTPRKYKVGTSLTDDGVLASDHRPVFATMSI